MKYPLLLLAIPLLACSAVKGEETGPLTANVTGVDSNACSFQIGDKREDIYSFKASAASGRELLVKGAPDAAYQCVIKFQHIANAEGVTATIDDTSWDAMASVSSGVFEPTEENDHPEAKPYDLKENSDPKVNVSMALSRAKAFGKRVILVMGANWCHDSRGFAGWLETPRLAKMMSMKYETVYVDVGFRDKNIDIAQRFGIEEIKGTPTVLVLSPDGKLLNPDSAPTWRNAASRSEEEIFDYFANFEPEK
ncbi:MAG: hypothetical protein Pars2KO_28800 [Parasphingorhabdus sp.]